MCMYFKSEVLLAHLLEYTPNSDDGIRCSDVEKYCGRIKAKLSEQESKDSYVYFGINNLENDVSFFPDQFKLFMGKYYKRRGFEIDFFSSLIQPETHRLLVEAAKTQG